MDDKQADSEKIGGSGNVVPEKNVAHTMDTWTAKKTNKMVLKEAKTNRSLVQKIRKQQATFFGHVMRREGLKHFLTTGKLDRKRSKGRQGEKTLDSLKAWLGAGRVTDMILTARDPNVWKDMITNVIRPGT